MQHLFRLFVFLLFSTTTSIAQAPKELTLKEIWATRTFVAKSVDEGKSMKDGKHFTTLQSGDKETCIIKYEYATGKMVDTILCESKIKTNGERKMFSMEDYLFSPNEQKILLTTNSEAIYRHSSKSENVLYDLMTGNQETLSSGKQMYPEFSPDGNKISFVRDNNIFFKDLADGKEFQVTSTGLQNMIINGSADWVYEEEFSFDKAYAWSPDGKKIAYYEFDESKVKQFSMAIYGTLYPSNYTFKYPKAGERNSSVKIYIFDVPSFSNTLVNTGNDTDQYIPRIKWTNDPSTLCVVRMNRLQNKLDLLLANAKDGSSKIILTEESKTYIDITDDLYFLNDNKTFFWSSEKEGFNHLYHYDLTGKQINQLTKGNWDIIEFNGFDDERKLLYYISAESSPMERDLFSVSLDGKKKTKISSRKGTNSASFSKGFKYFINYHSDANTPSYISLHTSEGKLVRPLEENSGLVATIKDYNLPKKDFFNFTTSEGVILNGWMIKPKNFDTAKKYPVFLTIYGGPGKNTVNDQWEGHNYLWHQFLASKGYIVVSVDNRGTLARGADFKKSTYLQLGKLETMDQIEAAKYFGSLPYVDKSRIGIDGWSFGGYLSSLCMTKGADFFKAGIAVAPVTNWRYYDSIYTERFLRTPQDNAKGYDDNSPINFVKDLKGKYLLVHGTADDNVHFQNSAEMVNALIKANKQFDFFMYPDRNHSIFGNNARLHLYTMMWDFINENL